MSWHRPPVLAVGARALVGRRARDPPAAGLGYPPVSYRPVDYRRVSYRSVGYRPVTYAVGAKSHFDNLNLFFDLSQFNNQNLFFDFAKSYRNFSSGRPGAPV
jgi:hypothetical protein